MKRVTYCCDSCGANLGENQGNENRYNVDVFVGGFQVQIEILKMGHITELCRSCRIEIVSNAVLEADRHKSMEEALDEQATERNRD